MTLINIFLTLIRGVPSDLLPVGSPRQRLHPLQEVVAGSVLRSRLPRRTSSPPVCDNDDMGIWGLILKDDLVIDHDKDNCDYLDHDIDAHNKDDLAVILIDHDKDQGGSGY